jgi:hypothetical protein
MSSLTKIRGVTHGKMKGHRDLGILANFSMRPMHAHKLLATDVKAARRGGGILYAVSGGRWVDTGMVHPRGICSNSKLHCKQLTERNGRTETDEGVSIFAV